MLLISRHGEEALDIAEREADRYQREHDELTSVVWCWISRATEALLKAEPDSGERLH